MKSAVREIERLVNVMESLTLESGLEPDVFAKSKEIDPAMCEEELADRLTFLQDIHDREYREVLAIKSLLPQSIWDSYRALGEGSLREQKLLRGAFRALKKAWRNKYGPQKQAAKPDGREELAPPE